ncbi:MAG: thiamine phosphate synthase [Chloroflexota bacterium]|nr:thiamine phosphate synthase [Chloroflexota bacterium]
MTAGRREGRVDPGELAARLAVYLVADPDATRRNLVEDVVAAVEGGATAVQLRAKRLSDREAWGLAIQLRQECRARGALFLVNDRVDLALAAQTDGVHLGMTDLPLAMARWLGGPGFVLGYSPETVDDAADAARQSADYVGLGPVFATWSKNDAGTPIGLGGLAERVEAAGMPAVGIGGITVGNAGEVIRAGAVGVSVISAILGAADPRKAAAELTQAAAAARGAGA